MEDESTQPTQDPRRLGRNNSGLAEEDISDLLCILHPGSPAAFRIVAHTALRSPQNVLQNHNFGSYDGLASNGALEEQETFILPTSSGSAEAMDLALRFSAKTMRPHLGFVFGRNAAACDIVLDTDTVKRVSNVHFRIFVNESGVLMLEDMSTNGTIVDDVVLRSKQQPGSQTRMLNNSSVIQILSPRTEEVVKFIVRIPSRDGYYQAFEEKFREYRYRVAVAEVNAREQEDAATGRKLRPVPHHAQTASHKLSLAGNSHFGMHWSGGDRYNVVGQIGKGAFAMVYQLATKSDGHLFAAKELEKRRFMKNGVLDRKIDNELQIMKAINHRHVVQYVEYQDIGQYLYIIMEFVPCGDLNQYLSCRGPLPEPLAKSMSGQVFDALDYLHRKKITHRDIKPDNILLADLDPANFTVKLSDFGLSKVVNTEETFLKTFCGTLLYCAPEVFPKYDDHVAGKSKKRPRRGHSAQPQKFHSYSQSVDIWSYGAVLWYSLCLRPPFEGVADATGEGMFNKIMMTPLDPTDLTTQGVSDEAVALLLKMLNTDPADRPTPAYCLSHPWFDSSEFKAPTEPYPDANLDIIAEEQEHEGVAEPNVAGLSLDERESGQNSQTSEVSINSGDMRFFDPRQSKRFKSENFGDRNKDGSLVESSPEVLFDHIPIANQTKPERHAAARSHHPKLFGEISQSGLQSSAVLGAQAQASTSQQSYGSQASSQGGSVQSGQQVNTQGAVASPSLLGAESLVRDLHMRSPNYSGSSPSGDADEPTTPNTPSRPKGASLEKGTPNDVTPKPATQPAFSRQIKLEITPSFYYDPSDPSTHNVEYASRVSGLDFTSRASYPTVKKSLPDTVAESETDKEEELYPTDNDEYDDTTQEGPERPELLAPVQFAKPAPRLGKLAATADSFAPIVLNLSRRLTSWGRAPNNTDIYSDNYDTRVSKRALILWFHAKGIDDVPQGNDSWTKLPGLKCVIATESSTGIYVNGVHLKRGEPGEYLFGHLYTGDEVTVAKGKNGLKFTCEFYHGECKDKRPEGDGKFSIQVAESKESVEKKLGANEGGKAAASHG